MSKQLTESEEVLEIKEMLKELPMTDRIILTLEFSIARNGAKMASDISDLLPMLAHEWMKDTIAKKVERRQAERAAQEQEKQLATRVLPPKKEPVTPHV
jgi:hypothetical protein